MATGAEQAAGRAAGVWVYDRFMQKYVERAGDRRLSKMPDALDTKPDRDEHDLDLLRWMEAAVRRGHAPPARSLAAAPGNHFPVGPF